jgi:hypothetical protein
MGKTVVNSSMNERAKEVPITSDYLQKFVSPLWDALDLEQCKPLTAVEGVQDNFPFAIIEMRHRAFGLLADNGQTAITTFFSVELPKAAGERRIARRLPEYQVSADQNYVYLALPGEQIRPGKWRFLVQQTIEVARSLDSVSADADVRPPSSRTYTPVGAGVIVHAFWGIVCLGFSLLFAGYGIAIIFRIVRSESVGFGAQLLLAAVGAFAGAIYYLRRVRKRL